MAAERQKVQSRRRDDVTDRERAAQRNQEVARYQKENKLLAEENERLNGRLEELMAECVGLSDRFCSDGRRRAGVARPRG